MLRRLSELVSTAVYTVSIPVPGRKPARLEAARSVVFEHVRSGVGASTLLCIHTAADNFP